MKKAGKILVAGCLAAALSMPVAVYGAEQVSVQLSARTGVPTVGSKHSAYENVAVSHVSNYVNVRTEPNTTSSIVGKIYNNCAATILATVDGEGGSWYQIQSGNVNGYIKAEYFITGDAAEKIARDVGTVYVTINTATLRLREEPNTESRTLTLLSQDAEYIEIREEADFVEIQVDADLSGYVHKDYIKERVEFEQAVTLEEEAAKKAEAERLKREADEAIAKVAELRKQAESAGAGTGESQNGAGENAGNTLESVGLIAKNPNEPAENGSNDTGKTGQNGTTQMTDKTQNNGNAQMTDKTQNNGNAPMGDKTQNNGNAPTADRAQQSGTPPIVDKTQQNGASQTADRGSTGGPSIGSGNTSGPSAADSQNKGASGDKNAAQNTGGNYGPGFGAGSNSGNRTGNSGGPGGNLSAELTSATRTAMVAYAKQFLGNPYVYGGTSLTEGADCSGFTMKIYEHFGINTGRTSRDQAANGREISMDALQPGDLLFYASGDTINHVAMYIGGGQIIHASTSKTGIVISTAYYRTPCKAVTFLD